METDLVIGGSSVISENVELFNIYFSIERMYCHVAVKQGVIHLALDLVTEKWKAFRSVAFMLVLLFF